MNLEKPKNLGVSAVFVRMPSEKKLELRIEALREKTTLTKLILNRLDKTKDPK